MDTYIPWDISDEKRQEYAASSRQSQLERKLADARAASLDDIALSATYKPEMDMPALPSNGIRTLSLFSGGGGLDLGFDLAGFVHHSSYEVLEFAGRTLQYNRPSWKINHSKDGDVKGADWKPYIGEIDFIHGGPPCQPFSIAGRRSGSADSRDMFPEFQRAVDELAPKAFLAENVTGFMSAKFFDYREKLLKSLRKNYNVTVFQLSSANFGVPQDRRRVFVVGIQKSLGKKFDSSRLENFSYFREVRNALGLPNNGVDGYAPTLRCTLSGPRQTTSIANSTASVQRWTELGIWPHGVSPDRKTAASFPTKNQTYRLCVPECQLIQGFPLSWHFVGAVYQRLGMIGNSVCPPVAYQIAKEINAQAFSS